MNPPKNDGAVDSSKLSNAKNASAPIVTKNANKKRDIGKKNNGKTTGFNFVAAKAAKEYGSKAAGDRVAGAIAAKIRAKG